MTLAKLKQLHALTKEIKKKQEKVEQLRSRVGLKASRISGMPHTGSNTDIIGDIVPAIADLESEINEDLQRKEQLRDEVIDWIDKTPDLEIQLYLLLFYADEMSWKQIAEYMDTGEGRITADSVRVSCIRYLKKALEPDS